MNQTNQIHAAEHNLKQISGHSIVASKKKRRLVKNLATQIPHLVKHTVCQGVLSNFVIVEETRTRNRSVSTRD